MADDNKNTTLVWPVNKTKRAKLDVYVLRADHCTLKCTGYIHLARQWFQMMSAVRPHIAQQTSQRPFDNMTSAADSNLIGHCNSSAAIDNSLRAWMSHGPDDGIRVRGQPAQP